MYLHVNIIISLLISVFVFFFGGGVGLFVCFGEDEIPLWERLQTWYSFCWDGGTNEKGNAQKPQGVLQTNWDPAAGMLCLNWLYELASLGDGHQYITAFLFCSQPELANLGSSSEFGPRSLVTQDPCSSASVFQLLPMCCAGTHLAYTEVHKSTQKRLQML